MSTDNLKQAVRMYQDGRRIRDILETTGVCTSVLYQALDLQGIPQRHARSGTVFILAADPRNPPSPSTPQPNDLRPDPAICTAVEVPRTWAAERLRDEQAIYLYQHTDTLVADICKRLRIKPYRIYSKVGASRAR